MLADDFEGLRGLREGDGGLLNLSLGLWVKIAHLLQLIGELIQLRLEDLLLSGEVLIVALASGAARPGGSAVMLFIIIVLLILVFAGVSRVDAPALSACPVWRSPALCAALTDVDVGE